MQKTENELIEIKKQNLLIIENQLAKGQLNDDAINAPFSGFTVINDIDRFIWTWLPEDFKQLHEINIEEDLKLTSLEFGLKYVHPNCIAKYVQKVVEARAISPDAPIELFEYVRTSVTKDYYWVHKVMKFSKKNNCIITVAHNLTNMNKEIESNVGMLGEHEFLRKNFNKYSSLTERQKEVLRLLALGHVNDSIAYEMNISPNTVRTYRNEIHKRLDLRWKNINHSQVYVRYASSFGLI